MGTLWRNQIRLGQEVVGGRKVAGLNWVELGDGDDLGYGAVSGTTTDGMHEGPPDDEDSILETTL